MKFTTALLLTALLGFALPLYAPWWSFAISSLLVALVIPQKPWRAFLAGFAGLFLLWGVQSAWLDSANSGLLSSKMAAMFGVGSGIVLILVTAFLGALISGGAALAGSFVVQPKRVRATVVEEQEAAETTAE
ncbi:hypothetical protein [Deminuibacter soli]|uniref:Uncharacterized protein n=1 Tax=Deminuibacter soli TaxID=2291815 RepID=A0A3E1NLY4_9BACT|nr:hypothetical protein [Deminuibacter soli]RFM28945.1 hypothetical protein DXN05_09275 [Deminuibacter soli]